MKRLWEMILKLFKKESQSTENEYKANDDYVLEYENVLNTNLTAIFANRLADYTTDESTLEIARDNKRAELLDEILDEVEADKKKITARIFGTGGIVLLPFVQNGKLYYSKVAQNRLSINKKIGSELKDITILADKYKQGYKEYYRWTDYRLDGNRLYIENRYTNEEGRRITKPTLWENVVDIITIPNVNKIPIAYIKSPIDNRLTNDVYGVPITYGARNTILKILNTLEQIEREFTAKEVFVGADSTMFDGNDGLPKNSIYKKVDSGEDSFWEVFDPAIRDSAYFNKLMNYFALLEKEVGTSRGILTEPLASYQNIDEVRRALRDTLSIINAMRERLEVGFKDFLDACEVLINYYNLAPFGEYKLDIVWSYALIEDYETTFNQYMLGLDKGIVEPHEVRHLITDESIEESIEAIEKIKEKNPSPKDLLGIE